MASRTRGEKKRPKFDPSLIRKKVRTRQVLSATLSENAHEFYDSACAAFGCDDLPAILDGCDSITRQLSELFLTVAEKGTPDGRTATSELGRWNVVAGTSTLERGRRNVDARTTTLERRR